ncbi:tetratricopeptide repeat protein [uncultured Megasphaera sp.]|uniref:tetratricopeptide repeat protein n=1 Tax=uncultured Megasphaera sp. TaxID=165188 RepID=UPI002595A4F8|nr:tetratricopeptide repeat protein [uncultured Megasphaera sp.]
MKINEIRVLYKAQKYHDIIGFYEKESEQTTWTPQDYYFYAYSLRKVKQYHKGHIISREGIIRYPQYHILYNVYCWCLYYTYIFPFQSQQQDKTVFLRAAASIFSYCKQNIYTPYERTVRKILQAFQGDSSFSYKQRDYYLSLLDPDKLAAEEKKVHADGTVTFYESPREWWYVQKTKYLLKLKQYDTCIHFCQEALRRISPCHNDNEIWFSYRMSMCEMHNHNTQRAAAILKGLSVYHRHWILYRGLMLVNIKKQQWNQAITEGSRAMLMPGERAQKIHVLIEIADILRQHVMDLKAAYWHETAALRLQKQYHWHIPIELQQRVELSSFPALTLEQVWPLLDAFWLQAAHLGETVYEGSISRILPGKIGGFVRLYDGQEFFFGKEEFLHTSLSLGLPVRFYLVSFTNNQTPLRAIDIRQS